MGLLRGESTTRAIIEEDVYHSIRDYKESGGDAEKIKGVIIGGLVYLRDRISVPSDMTFAQARYLRAYINWLVDIVAAMK